MDNNVCFNYYKTTYIHEQRNIDMEQDNPTADQFDCTQWATANGLSIWVYTMGHCQRPINLSVHNGPLPTGHQFDCTQWATANVSFLRTMVFNTSMSDYHMSQLSCIRVSVSMNAILNEMR